MKTTFQFLLTVGLASGCLLTPPCKAADSTNNKVRSADFSLFTELGGSGLYWATINGEVTVFKFRESSGIPWLFHTLRVSAGITLIPANRLYAPVLVRLLLFQSDYHLEVGVGASVLVSELSYTGNGEHWVKNDRFVPCGVIGFRGESRRGGLQLRAAFTPIVDPADNRVYAHFGFGVGWAF